MSFDIALVDSDFHINSDGTIKTVEKTEKLRQDVIKIILTPIGSMKFHTWYGSAINDNTIGTILPDNILFQNLSTAISESLEKLVVLQRAQSSQQRVDAAELIASIREVSVQRNPQDPRQVNVIVHIIAKNLVLLEDIFTIRS